VLPRATAARVQQVVQQEWGQGLIGSWNSAGWMDLPQRVGDKIARLVGRRGELVWPTHLGQPVQGAERGAVDHRRPTPAAPRDPVSERSNFPTDLYIAEALARERGFTLVLAEPDDLPAGWTHTPRC
jgi:kynureninase